MPRMAGTGPTGQGSRTGRGLGPCGTSGANAPQGSSSLPTSWLGRTVMGALGGLFSGDYGAGQGGGRGAGVGRGQGRGRRRML